MTSQPHAAQPPSPPPAAGEPVPSLLERFRAVRARSLELARPLSDEDMTPQSMPDASPAKWHLAHTSWFFETFVLDPFWGAAPFDAEFRVLFNSYYEGVGPRPERHTRGLVTRPSVERVRRYRAHVDAGMARFLAGPVAPEAEALVVLGLAHEEQHQELLLTDVLHLFSCSPLLPAYHASAPAPSEPAPALRWRAHPGGLAQIGREPGAGFGFDNEGPRHRVLLHPFRLADRLATNAEWAAFIASGGYDEPTLWLSDGWAAAQAGGWRAPLYWRETPVGWAEFGFHGLRPLDPHAPVRHVSYYEADAYARWRGLRLPTEFEWEAAVGEDAADGEGEDGQVRLRQLYDTAWQWTASAYAAYPGFSPATGAVGEYNGKFMINQMVLRGGSCATSPGHGRPTYRNFFHPEKRWQVFGVRLAGDLAPEDDHRSAFASDVLEGLSRPQKSLPAKWFYDEAGSALFERICELPEYYLTRTELALLREAAPEIARLLPGGAALVEFGSGASLKTRALLDAAPQLAAYLPLDISEAALGPAAEAIARDYPELEVVAVRADFTRRTALPDAATSRPRVGFFPGSTIGNFAPDEARDFLRRARATLGEGALFLVGFDLRKSAAVLTPAYDDAAGVTAAFNRNLLVRINRELGGDFDLDAFAHRALWNAGEGRMEMRLESSSAQTVRVLGRPYAFAAGETIHTESSYKHTQADFERLSAQAGWRRVRSWASPEPHGLALTLLQA